MDRDFTLEGKIICASKIYEISKLPQRYKKFTSLMDCTKRGFNAGIWRWKKVLTIFVFSIFLYVYSPPSPVYPFK
jgi:hypothetical protein